MKLINVILAVFTTSLVIGQDNISNRNIEQYYEKQLVFAVGSQYFYTSMDAPNPTAFSAKLDNDKNSLKAMYTFGHGLNNSDIVDLFQLSLGIALKTTRNGSFYNLFTNDNLTKNFGVNFSATYTFDEEGKPNSSALAKKSEKERVRDAEYLLFEDFQAFIDTSIDRKWFEIDAYLPISKSEYTNTITSATFDPKKVGYSNWSASITGHWIKKKKTIWYGLAAGYRWFNNNNIETKALKSSKFLNLGNIDENGFQSVVEKTAFVGVFDEFSTHQVMAQGTMLLLNGKVGFSGAIDFNFGIDKNTNWKLGFPININSKALHQLGLELQWREFNKTHYIGLSAGKMLGNFIN